MKRLAMQIPIIVKTIMKKIMMKYDLIKEMVKRAYNDTQHQNSMHPKTSPIDCDAVQLTNAQ